MPSKEKSTFSHFFKEETKNSPNLKGGQNGQKVFNEVISGQKETFPKIRGTEKAAEEEFNVHWQRLMLFFRNSNNDRELPQDLSPAILAPNYIDNLVGSDFPVWVADEDFEGKGDRCLTLKEMLTNNLDKLFAGKENANILKDNIDGIIYNANEQLKDNKPHLFYPVIDKALDQLEKQLEISGDEATAFNGDLKNLKQELPQNGVLLPYSGNVSFQILAAAMMAAQTEGRKEFKFEIDQLCSKLNDLLRIEAGNNPGKGNSDESDSSQFAGDMLNFDSISSLSVVSGSESLGDQRVDRIAAILKDLDKAENLLKKRHYLFVDELIYKKNDWEEQFGKSEVRSFKKGNGCSEIRSSFSKNIKSWTKLFAAKRMAELEIHSNYQVDVHDEYFKHFDWKDLSDEELSNCPHHVLIADDIQLFEYELNKVSAILSESIPIRILTVKRDNFNTSKKGELNPQSDMSAWMFSYKNIFVAQSTSITPKYLFDCFNKGLNSFAPAFFNVMNADVKLHKNPYLWTSASVESRDFPGFAFNGQLGSPWSSRFEIDNNPQVELSWPIHALMVENSEGEIIEMEFPFTFADRAVLDPACHRHFMTVDPSFWNENLIHLTEYLENNTADNTGKLPFIWMIDRENDLQKLVVSWSMVIAAQERLDFWRFLQENSGINNYHASRAAVSAREEMQEQHNKEIDALKSEHQVEIQRIRDEEAGRAMEDLTSVLLNLDTANVIAANAPSPGPAPVSDPAAVEDQATGEDAAEVVQEEESLLTNDPYIDTALCTTCNECTDLNGAMFNYNSDKLAFIADPTAGTFKELVEAAELCPVEVIHPGSPINPNEADLDSLVKRAEKFN